MPGEGFSNLLRNPFCRWVGGHVDPHKLSSGQPDNNQYIEQIEADGRDHEQIHGSKFAAYDCAALLDCSVCSFPCGWERTRFVHSQTRCLISVGNDLSLYSCLA